MLSFLTDPLLTLIYPQQCGSCGHLVEKAFEGAACRACWTATKIFAPSDPICSKCGAPLPSISDRSVSACNQCDDDHYDTARSAGVYEKALSASVLRLKQEDHVPGAIGQLLRIAFDSMPLPKDLTIVPVPLSKQRLLERGFNQAKLLARAIAQHSRRPLDEFSLARKQDTPMHRAAMDRKAREASVRNVFHVVRPSLIRGRNILLVDDLMTSGSTVSYCAKALKRSGAGEVHVLTLARAV